MCFVQCTRALREQSIWVGNNQWLYLHECERSVLNRDLNTFIGIRLIEEEEVERQATGDWSMLDSMHYDRFHVNVANASTSVREELR